MNEAETIDPTLKAAGRGVVEGHGKRGKALTADYVLVYRNQGVGQAADGSRGTSEELRGQAAPCLLHERAGLARLSERKLAALAALKKSRLHQAFSGAL